MKDIEDATPIPIVLVGNECDKEEERVVSRHEGEALAQEWGCPFLETSVKTNNNIQETFAEIIRQIRRN